MSCCEKNFLIGQPVTFEAFFRSGKNCPLIAIDQNPLTFSIFQIKTECVGKKTKEITTQIDEQDAVKIETGHYSATWTIPVDVDTNATYKIVWNATIGGVKINAEELFSITAPAYFSSDAPDPFEIDIPDDFLALVKSVLAYPLENKILLDDDQIKKICIKPSLIEFFTRFPIKERFQTSVSASTIVPFPDLFTYGASQASVNGKQSQALGHQGNFYQLLLINKGYGYSGSAYNTYGNPNRRGLRGYGFNPNGLRQESRNYKYVLDTLANDNTFNVHVNLPKRQIEVEATTQAEVLIVWAKWSNCWNDIPFPRQMEVVYLCQSKLLQHFVDTVQMTDDGNTEQSINYSELQTRATDLRSEVMDIWRIIPNVIAIRGS